MKFNWALNSINKNKKVREQSAKRYQHIERIDGEIMRVFSNGNKQPARFTASSVDAEDWVEVK